ELITTMSNENRLWGTEWIRGELLKLGIVVSNRSIRRYRWRRPPRSPSQTWRTFLAKHAHHLWAADLFTMHTLTFKTLYVLVFIAPRPARAGARERDRQPYGGLGVATGHRGDGLGQQAAPS